MGQFIDITGMKFGRLTVIRRVDSRPGKIEWLAQCECGGSKVAAGQNIRGGMTRSCGCLVRETTSKRSKTHGHFTGRKMTHEYRAWRGILTRCFNRNEPNYCDYGGRGITICDEWRRDFPRFLAAVGYRPGPGFSIDRINNDGNYEPGNVRWADRRTQNTNRRNTIRIEGRTLQEIADEYGINVRRLRSAHYDGRDVTAFARRYGLKASQDERENDPAHPPSPLQG